MEGGRGKKKDTEMQGGRGGNEEAGEGRRTRLKGGHRKRELGGKERTGERQRE